MSDQKKWVTPSNEIQHKKKTAKTKRFDPDQRQRVQIFQGNEKKRKHCGKDKYESELLVLPTDDLECASYEADKEGPYDLSQHRRSRRPKESVSRDQYPAQKDICDRPNPVPMATNLVALFTKKSMLTSM
jgi:hypothetical protein